MQQEFNSRLAQSPPSPCSFQEATSPSPPFSHPNITVTEEGYSSRNRILTEKGMGAPCTVGLQRAKTIWINTNHSPTLATPLS